MENHKPRSLVQASSQTTPRRRPHGPRHAGHLHRWSGSGGAPFLPEPFGFACQFLTPSPTRWRRTQQSLGRRKHHPQSYQLHRQIGSLNTAAPVKDDEAPVSRPKTSQAFPRTHSELHTSRGDLDHGQVTEVELVVRPGKRWKTEHLHVFADSPVSQRETARHAPPFVVALGATTSSVTEVTDHPQR